MESSGRLTWHFRGGSDPKTSPETSPQGKRTHFFIPLPETNSLPLKMGAPWKLGDPELGKHHLQGRLLLVFGGVVETWSISPSTWWIIRISFSGEEPWWSYPKSPRPGVVGPLPNGRPKWHINWCYLLLPLVPQTSSSPLKIGRNLQRKGSPSNPSIFRGDLLVAGRVLSGGSSSKKGTPRLVGKQLAHFPRCPISQSSNAPGRIAESSFWGRKNDGKKYGILVQGGSFFGLVIFEGGGMYRSRYCWWFRNPANSPADMVHIPLFAEFYHQPS